MSGNSEKFLNDVIKLYVFLSNKHLKLKICSSFEHVEDVSIIWYRVIPQFVFPSCSDTHLSYFSLFTWAFCHCAK